MARKLAYIVLALVAAVAFSGPAQADTIGTKALTGCGSGGPGCPDATYSFDIGTTSASLTIHITGTVTAGVNDIIGGVNLGFTNSSNVSGLTLSANPGGGWATVTTGSLSNAGCGSNSGAFVCASGTGVSIVTGGTYTWTWTYTLADPNAIFGVADVHIGANYNPHNGLIVSETGASTVQTPEAASLALLGLGLIGVPFLRRRRES
jgi:hypothetical protein